MSFLIKASIGLAVLVGVAALPAPATQIVLSPAKAVSAPVAPAHVPRAVALAQEVAGDQHCFVARKKSAKRKAANHVRLVKVCE